MDDNHDNNNNSSSSSHHHSYDNDSCPNLNDDEYNHPIPSSTLSSLSVPLKQEEEEQEHSPSPPKGLLLASSSSSSSSSTATTVSTTEQNQHEQNTVDGTTTTISSIVHDETITSLQQQQAISTSCDMTTVEHILSTTIEEEKQLADRNNHNVDDTDHRDKSAAAAAATTTSSAAADDDDDITKILASIPPSLIRSHHPSSNSQPGAYYEGGTNHTTTNDIGTSTNNRHPYHSRNYHNYNNNDDRMHHNSLDTSLASTSSLQRNITTTMTSPTSSTSISPLIEATLVVEASVDDTMRDVESITNNNNNSPIYKGQIVLNDQIDQPPPDMIQIHKVRLRNIIISLSICCIILVGMIITPTAIFIQHEKEELRKKESLDNAAEQQNSSSPTTKPTSSDDTPSMTPTTTGSFFYNDEYELYSILFNHSNDYNHITHHFATISVVNPSVNITPSSKNPSNNFNDDSNSSINYTTSTAILKNIFCTPLYTPNNLSSSILQNVIVDDDHNNTVNDILDDDTSPYEILISLSCGNNISDVTTTFMKNDQDTDVSSSPTSVSPLIVLNIGTNEVGSDITKYCDYHHADHNKLSSWTKADNNNTHTVILDTLTCRIPNPSTMPSSNATIDIQHYLFLFSCVANIDDHDSSNDNNDTTVKENNYTFTMNRNNTEISTMPIASVQIHDVISKCYLPKDDELFNDILTEQDEDDENDDAVQVNIDTTTTTINVSTMIQQSPIIVTSLQRLCLNYDTTTINSTTTDDEYTSFSIQPNQNRTTSCYHNNNYNNASLLPITKYVDYYNLTEHEQQQQQHSDDEHDIVSCSISNFDDTMMTNSSSNSNRIVLPFVSSSSSSFVAIDQSNTNQKISTRENNDIPLLVLLNEPRYHVNNLIIVDHYDNSIDYNNDNQYCYSSILNDGFLFPKDLNFTEEASTIDTMEYNIWDEIKNTKEFYDTLYTIHQIYYKQTKQAHMNIIHMRLMNTNYTNTSLL